MTAKAVRQALIDEKDWTDERLPHENTIGVILNRLGYRLRRVQKKKPIKRIKETDAIFEQVHRENKKSDQRADSLRISIDSKAKVDWVHSRGMGSREAPVLLRQQIMTSNQNTSSFRSASSMSWQVG
jgi:hypothetical protein